MNEYVCNSMLQKKLRLFMKKWRFSQRYMADFSGVGHSTISSILAGHGFKCRTCAKLMTAMREK